MPPPASSDIGRRWNEKTEYGLAGFRNREQNGLTVRLSDRWQAQVNQRCTRGSGTRAVSLAMKSMGSKKICVVPSRRPHGSSRIHRRALDNTHALDGYQYTLKEELVKKEAERVRLVALLKVGTSVLDNTGEFVPHAQERYRKLLDNLPR